jgi:hypothetical protein
MHRILFASPEISPLFTDGAIGTFAHVPLVAHLHSSTKDVWDWPREKIAQLSQSLRWRVRGLQGPGANEWQSEEGTNQ